jgi:hypothetical protein
MLFHLKRPLMHAFDASTCLPVPAASNGICVDTNVHVDPQAPACTCMLHMDRSAGKLSLPLLAEELSCASGRGRGCQLTCLPFSCQGDLSSGERRHNCGTAALQQLQSGSSTTPAPCDAYQVSAAHKP